MNSYIKIFDTTLRDGDQASGFHFLRSEKLSMARQLERLGVDIIEAGFPASSEGDFISVRQIAKEIRIPTICGLSRAVISDIETAARALEHSSKPRIHTFIATSDIHVNSKFKKGKSWVLEQAVNAVRKARNYVNDVEFSCEDFGRSDPDYTLQVASEAIRAGASTINLPDTVGFLLPDEIFIKYKYVLDKIKALSLEATFSSHNHNDMGMATANTIQAIRAGARQVEVTINGIGERAGNASLEEVVAAIKIKGIGLCNIQTRYIAETSRLCSEYTGVTPTPNKAIVGKNAFAHEAGIHSDGMLKDRTTYEIINPLDYGMKSVQTFGPRSGRNALAAKYTGLGITFNDGQFEIAYREFKRIGDNKKIIEDSDLINAARLAGVSV